MYKLDIVRDRLPDLNTGFFLWVWYADKIPPHIGCSLDGEYFSLKVSGKDMELPVKKVLGLIERKGLAFLLVDVNKQLSKSALLEHFSNYDKAAEGRSCLTPIINVFGNPEQVNLLVDLIQYLERNDGIKCIFGLNLPADYNGLPVYSMDEVNSRLLKLERAEKQVNISESC